MEAVSAYKAEPYSYREARALVEGLGLSEPVAVTLVRRGYRTLEDARAFLDADESHPPEAFKSMATVVERVLAAIEGRQRIAVHGDFDVDGVCATTILVGALRDHGADCDWLIPNRIGDGYGLAAENVERLAQRNTSLIITVDCGISAAREVALAQSLGMEVIVTDHHQPGSELPDCPILHPSLDGYPFEHLCGTAVAWKLSCALREVSGVGSPGTPREREPGDPVPGALTLGTYRDIWAGPITELNPPLKFLQPRQRVELSLADAQSLELKSGDTVRVSQNGSAVEASVQIRERIEPGTCFLIEGTAEGNANQLLNGGPVEVQISKELA